MFNVLLTKEVKAENESIWFEIDIKLPFAPSPGLGLPDQLARITSVSWIGGEFSCDVEPFDTASENLGSIMDQHINAGWWIQEDRAA